MRVPEINKEANFLIKLTEGLYRETRLPDVNIREINIGKFIRIALENNILYYAARRIVEDYPLRPDLKARFEAIVKEGNLELIEIRKGISEVKKYIENYIIFKTYRGEDFPRIANDIDVLAKNENLDSIKKQFIARGYHAEYDDPRERSVGLLKEGRKKIHLQGAITWCWTEYLDNELIYRNPRNVVYNGREITIPNINADFLIHIAHMNFEPLLLIYSELLYLFKLIPEVDFDILLEQTRKYNWQKTFLRTINLISNFHYILYGDLCCSRIKFKKIDFNILSFPYVFSIKHIVLASLEKRLLTYPLTKIPKILSLLLTQDAYKYIDSPERRMLK